MDISCCFVHTFTTKSIHICTCYVTFVKLCCDLYCRNYFAVKCVLCWIFTLQSCIEMDPRTGCGTHVSHRYLTHWCLLKTWICNVRWHSWMQPWKEILLFYSRLIYHRFWNLIEIHIYNNVILNTRLKFNSIMCKFYIVLAIQRRHNEWTASQITSLTVVYSSTDERKHRSSASLAFVRVIHRWPVYSRRKGPVTQKMSPFDDVIVGMSGFISRNICVLMIAPRAPE